MTQNNVFSNKLDQLCFIADSALQKQAAVDAATLAGGGDPAAMGMDPAMAGGDPMAAMGGGDPMAAGGAPPGPDPMEQRLAALEAQLAAGGGAGGAGGVEPIKPKIDVNVEMMQIKKMLAKVVDTLGIQMPASEMVATQEDLTGMGMQDQAGAGGAGGGSAISPIEPMQAASPAMAGGGEPKMASYQGEAYDGSGFEKQLGQAEALYMLMNQGQS